MPVKIDRQYRGCEEFRAASTEEYIVEGYASTFKPYLMFEDGENKYYERIDPHAFDEADMSDVIMQYDHNGRVFARQSNGTLQLSIDDHGLKVRADLSRTEGSRQLYEDIKSGMITRMSFAFSVAEDSYDRESHTRNVLRVKRLYDVSAVSIPANPDTAISARSYFEGVIEQEKQELLKAEKREKDIAILKLLLEV